MDNRFKFTKENTAVIKGIAICFLLWYHNFGQKERLGGAIVSFWPLPEWLAFAVSRCMVHCVGIFAFLSVYGLTLTMKKSYKNYEFTGHDALLFVIKRYVKLVLTFAVPFVVGIGITYLLGKSRYRNGTAINLINLAMDFLGVGHLFGTQMMLSTWWYISLEIMLIVFLPFVLRFYRKYSWLIVAMFMIPGSFMLEKNVSMTKYLFVVPLAVCFADQRVLERLKGYMLVKNRILNKVFKFLISSSVLFILLKIWDSKWGRSHFEFILFGLIPVMMIYWFYEFLMEIPLLCPVLSFLGKHSADIFYVHTFIRALWLKELTYSFGHAVFIWMFLMGTSLLFSLILDLIRKMIHFDRISAVTVNKITEWADVNL